MIVDDLVAKKVYAVVPPKVEDSSTKIADSLSPILNSLCKWGEQLK